MQRVKNLVSKRVELYPRALCNCWSCDWSQLLPISILSSEPQSSFSGDNGLTWEPWELVGVWELWEPWELVEFWELAWLWELGELWEPGVPWDSGEFCGVLDPSESGEFWDSWDPLEMSRFWFFSSHLSQLYLYILNLIIFIGKSKNLMNSN